ncbi:universal stress protein [Microvirga lotononidis]|uniref:Universal stress protein UspA-like protein n=1 Tax=Microvirga lotononidis TaxID=864069 RepID=I4YV95_9HYPH|nr:universal stress protein [Microvirga lotononidis]EIM27887.1 universal stress protein UspA-like protein [Microvirga lotononidis]WQO27985.1 universal stress protein [Microvirga lotononidis]
MIKDIMVHLDGSAEDEIRLEYGQAIAAAGQAHLIGIFTNLLSDITIPIPMDGGGAVVQVLAELDERARREGDVTAKRLTERMASLQLPNEFRRLDETYGVLSAKVAELARCADVFIATRPHRKPDMTDWSDLVEAVLFGSGRALLLVPPGRHRQGPIRTVLVAWNGSREAARALREGLSFIDQAARTIVLVVDPPEDMESWNEVERHLARHDIVPELISTESGNRGIGEAILEEASRLSADLIIMGGYGHARLREQVFGGATRDVLQTAASPLLIAH